jgi:hypothetical protein
MGQSANITHFVVLFISFQNVETFKLPFEAHRGKKKKSAVFAPK